MNQGNFLALTAIVMWGALALLGKQTQAIAPFLLLAMCFFIAALIMPCIRLFKGEPLLTRPRLTLRSASIGVGALLGFHACYFMALDYAPVIAVSLIGYLWPMLLALLVASKGRKLQAFIGSCLGLLAVSMVLGWHNISFESVYLKGYLLALACAVIWAAYSWYLSVAITHSNDMTWLCLSVSIGALLISYWSELWVVSFDFVTLISVILLGLGPVGGAFYVWERGLKLGNKSLISSLSFSTPLISACLLALFGQVAWSNNLMVSLLLIVAASVIINFKKIDKKDDVQSGKAIE